MMSQRVTWCCQGKIYTWNCQFGLDMGHGVDVHRNHGTNGKTKGFKQLGNAPLHTWEHDGTHIEH
jgi:hypothetical protein